MHNGCGDDGATCGLRTSGSRFRRAAFRVWVVLPVLVLGTLSVSIRLLRLRSCDWRSEVRYHVNAEVYIDGAYAGTVGKLKTMHLRPGSYDIEVLAAGRTQFDKKVYVAAGKT